MGFGCRSEKGPLATTKKQETRGPPQQRVQKSQGFRRKVWSHVYVCVCGWMGVCVCASMYVFVFCFLSALLTLSYWAAHSQKGSPTLPPCTYLSRIFFIVHGLQHLRYLTKFTRIILARAPALSATRRHWQLSLVGVEPISW